VRSFGTACTLAFLSLSLSLSLFLAHLYLFFNQQGVIFVPQQEAWVVEWMGKFTKVLPPGVNFLVPVLHAVRYVHSLKVCTLHMAHQEAITSDNVSITIDGVLYWQVKDPVEASYSIEDPEDAIMQLAQGIMRSEVGRMLLEKTFQERSTLNKNIVEGINSVASDWGVECLRYEIQNIHPPHNIRDAMEVLVVTERHKRRSIIQSEGAFELDVILTPSLSLSATHCIHMHTHTHTHTHTHSVNHTPTHGTRIR
jgi:stomatin-like protein 2